jgi:hypothetical protein
VAIGLRQDKLRNLPGNRNSLWAAGGGQCTVEGVQLPPSTGEHVSDHLPQGYKSLPSNMKPMARFDTDDTDHSRVRVAGAAGSCRTYTGYGGDVDDNAR